MAGMLAFHVNLASTVAAVQSMRAASYYLDQPDIPTRARVSRAEEERVMTSGVSCRDITSSNTAVYAREGNMDRRTMEHLASRRSATVFGCAAARASPSIVADCSPQEHHRRNHRCPPP